MNTYTILQILIIFFSFITMGLILLNQPETAQTFGSKSSFEKTRRGFEKTIHTSTIISSALIIVFVLLSQIVK
jgi:protein translocase SecG subunit